jgi:hypothetical protein
MATTHFNQTTKTIARHWEAFVTHGGMFPRSGASAADSRTTTTADQQEGIRPITGEAASQGLTC